MVRRKGQMHVLDAIAAVIILLFFSVGNFSGGEYRDWSSYENKLAAKDLSHTMEETGYVESFIRRGETGNFKTAISTVSARDYDAAGKIQGVPPNLDIGFSVMPSDISDAELTRVESGDRCYGDLEEIQKRSSVPILRTEGGSGTAEAGHGDVRLYFGNYEGVTSVLEYNAIWVDNGAQCSFQDPTDPVRKFELFEWGPSDSVYEFRQVSVNDDTWEGSVNFAQAEQIRRFQRSMNQRVGAVNNRVEIDSFRIDEQVPSQDFLVFRGTDSLDKIKSSEFSLSTVSGTPKLFLANLDQSYLEAGDVLYNQGFRWEDLDFEAENGANCPLSGSQSIQSGCNLRVGFSDSAESQEIKGFMIDQQTDFSQISIYPKASITSTGKTPISFEKPLYLKNYAYENLNDDIIRKDMSPTSVSGAPSTSCNNATTANFDFPNLDGNMESISVVNTQLGQSSSYCSRNNRALYLDLDQDGDYMEDNEGPYLDGEIIDVNQVTYRVRIYSSLNPDCGTDDCAGFLLNERPEISLVNYNSETNSGRLAYESSYSETDRRVVSSVIYMMSKPMGLASISEGSGVRTDIYGVIGERPYNVNLRWSN